MSNMAASNSLLGWTRFFNELDAFNRACEIQSGSANRAFTEYSLERLQTGIRSVSSVLDNIKNATPTNATETSVYEDYSGKLSDLLSCLRELSQEWQLHLDRCIQQSSEASYASPSVRSSGRGRPKFDISKEQLEFLASMSFTWTQIAEMLGVSRMTIYRRRVEYQMVHESNGSISDDDLKVVLNSLRKEHPSMGQTMVWGQLRAMGFSVTRERVRAAVHESDPLYTALCWGGHATIRRPYSVPGPNSLCMAYR